MREIWIPELLSSLLVLVFLLRPLFKGLWPLDGIAWFPVLALGIALAIFPAYGFRPECVPLAINHLVVALMNLKPLLAGARRGARFRERGALFIVPALGFLVLTGAAALRFAPAPPRPVNARTLTLRGPGGTGSPRYTLRVFEDQPPAAEPGEPASPAAPVNPGEAASPAAPAAPAGPGSAGTRPLIFLVPPDFGRLDAVDGVCAALGDRGFTVISYTRADSPSPGRLFRLWRAFRNGTRFKKANDAGRALEEERKAELEFLLPYVKANLASLAPRADGNTLFLAGWGSGGSALAYLVSLAGPAGNGTALPATGPYNARGLIVVEGRFWSSWTAAPPPASAAPLNAFFTKFRALPDRFRPERVEVPELVPRPLIPVLYLVSGRALDKDAGQDYAAVFRALRNSAGPAALALMEGAGPLDYSDLPAEYPLYNALLSGRPGGYAEDAAGLIARFCELAAAGPPGTQSSPAAPPAFTGRLRLPGGLYLETRSWNFGDLRLHWQP